MAEIRDEELIQLARRQLASTAAQTLSDIGEHTTCHCDSTPGSEHRVFCPISVWHQAARAVRLLGEAD
jgi:hypothetical protein